MTVAAASDLRYAFAELRRAFQAEHAGVDVDVTFGSSGSMATQISNGAPYDVFLSADVTYVRALASRGDLVAHSEFRYAVGRLVLFASAGGAIDPSTRGWDTLRDDSVRRIAIANPRHAPYGRAAEAAMRSVGVYDAVASRLVFGENVSQAVQMVESGAADVGVVARSLVRGSITGPRGRVWEVPAAQHPRLDQGGGIVRRTHEGEAARAFVRFLVSARAREILVRSGFDAPE